MNLTPKSKKFQHTDKSETTAKWQDCVVEELSDEAQAAVSGGGRGTPHYASSPEETLLSLSGVIGG
jgi:hypothetical protein